MCFRHLALSSELIDPLARSTLHFLAASRELQHDPATLALLLANLGRRHFVDGLAPGALDLLWAGDELKHRAAVVAD